MPEKLPSPDCFYAVDAFQVNDLMKNFNYYWKNGSNPMIDFEFPSITEKRFRLKEDDLQGKKLMQAFHV